MRALDEQTSVSGQISPDDLAQLAAAGVTRVICNRPDAEEPEHPAMTEIAAAAAAAPLGITLIEAPFQGRPPRAAVEALQSALDAGERVHAYCRSGMRSASVWAIVQVESGRDVETVLTEARAAGYDLAALFA